MCIRDSTIDLLILLLKLDYKFIYKTTSWLISGTNIKKKTRKVIIKGTITVSYTHLYLYPEASKILPDTSLPVLFYEFKDCSSSLF